MLLRAQHGEDQLSGQTADGRPGIRAVFGYPAYRRLWAARTASAAGDAFATVALSLLVLDLTGSGLDSRGYGLALTLIGAGAVLGTMVLSRFVSNPRRPAFVFGPYLVRAAVDGVLAFTLSPVLALGALAGYGLGTSTGAVTFNSLLQAETPQKHEAGFSPRSTSSGNSDDWSPWDRGHSR